MSAYRLRDLPGWATEAERFYGIRNTWYTDGWAPADIVFQLAGDIVVPVKPPASVAYGTRPMITRSIDLVEYIMNMRHHVAERVSGSGFRVIRGGAP